MNLFTFPDASSTISAVSSYSQPWFLVLVVFAGLIIGVSVASMGTNKLISVVTRGIAKVLGGKRKGGRRRR